MPRWVPSGYRSLAQRCWHPAAAARPSADELVRQLERLGAGRAWKTSRGAQQAYRNHVQSSVADFLYAGGGVN